VDLRLFTSNVVEIPVLIRPKTLRREVVTRSEVRTEQVDFTLTEDNKIVVTLRKKKAEDVPVIFGIESTDRNFEKQVSIKGSLDDQAWETLVEGEPVFDYSRYMDVRKTEIRVPPGAYTFYNIEVSDISESQRSPLKHIITDSRGGDIVSEREKTSFRRADFHIDHIRVHGEKKSLSHADKVLSEYTVRDLKVRHDLDKKSTLVTFSTARVPLTKVILVTDAKNFSRSCRLEARHAEDDTWQYVAAGKLSRVRAGRFSKESLDLRLPSAPRHRFYRLTIRNQDSPALDIEGIEIRGEVHEALFFAKPNVEVRLCYGADNMRAPIYDIVEVLQQVDAAHTSQYGLGPEIENPTSAEAEAPLVSGKVVLACIVFVMVIVLIYLIARAARHIDTFEEKH